MMIVWKLGWKMIVRCCIVCMTVVHTCTVIKFACWFRFRFRFCVLFRFSVLVFSLC